MKWRDDVFESENNTLKYTQIYSLSKSIILLSEFFISIPLFLFDKRFQYYTTKKSQLLTNFINNLLTKLNYFSCFELINIGYNLTNLTYNLTYIILKYNLTILMKLVELISQFK